MNRCFKIFILSDLKTKTNQLIEFLSDYDNYELHFIPTEINLFDVLNYEPDIVILDKDVKKVVKCYEWEAVA
mgnify:FL=1|jgi:hypothetical protein